MNEMCANCFPGISFDISFMDDAIQLLQASLDDEVFSKSERKSFKALLATHQYDVHQLAFLRSQVYELAQARVNKDNYNIVLEWVKNATGALVVDPVSDSDVFFSPGDACRQVINTQINNAIRQLHICVFTISDDTITDALITAHQRGVAVRIITDNDKSLDEGSDIEQLASEGLEVRMDTSPNHMHHKFMVADGRSLLTGSYNWTRSAARFNHENVLLTTDAGVIKSYLKEFEKLWKIMTPYNG
jgi:phosphatidylserine/phosphatidylglycerophosphate/cardiolipin synthase-like enzyme